MRIAALYDIHGNLPALDAVLEDVRASDVDRIIVGGDVLPGPMPRATLSRLLSLELPVQCIQGNGDREVLLEMQGAGTVPEPYRDIMRHSAAQLTAERAEIIARWPATLDISMPELGRVLFCHATPTSDTAIVTRRTPADAFAEAFAGTDAAVVVCGHTHMQFDRTIGTVRVVNAGSVGMPFGDPGAYWLLLGSTIEFRYTRYDTAGAADSIRTTDYPHAHEFALHNVLEPPSESSMLERFSPTP